MKAFIVDNYGKHPLRLGDVAAPEVQPGDVLIQIHAASVNLLDAKIRSGEFKLILPYRLPLVLGHDVAGTVIAVGADVTAFRVGDEVYARPDDFRIGTFAEQIAVAEHAVAPKPNRLSMQEAAAIPLVALTAWQALVERAQLKPGESVFIQAGSGGVGSIAIQLAKHLGAHVTTTASASNAAWLKSLGADVVIDYKTEDFGRILRDVDVVLHSQDADALEKSLGVLKPGGRLISISGPPDPTFARAIAAPWYVRLATRLLSRGARGTAKKRGVSYSFLFMRAHGGQLREIGALIDAGVIRPVIDSTFPFAEVNDAVTRVESGRAKGKVVVTMR